MLQEIRDLGFEYAELSHGIRLSLLPGIFEGVEAGVIKISSLHNFCPLPIGVTHASPNLFKFTSLDARERDNAYKHTLKTLETAERVGASLVVLHMGAVEMKDYTDRLVDMVGDELRETPKYTKLCDEAMEKREAKKERHIEAAYSMLRRIEEQAASRNIRLGIENREAIEEIPFESDFMFFFKEFPSPTVCYWHDTGHAQIKENLGFIDHVLHLESMADRLAGFHIHDVQFPGRDHCPPGTGCIQFEALAPFVKPHHLKIFEMNPGLHADDVMAGVAHIKKLWGND